MQLLTSLVAVNSVNVTPRLYLYSYIVSLLFKVLETSRATLRNPLPTHRSIIPNLSGPYETRTPTPACKANVLANYTIQPIKLKQLCSIRLNSPYYLLAGTDGLEPPSFINS